MKWLKMIAIVLLGISTGPWVLQAQGPVPSSPTASPVRDVVTSQRDSRPSLHPSPGAVRGEEDIRDIRGPVRIPSAWIWFVCAGCVLAAAGALYATWRWFQNRALATPKLPHEIALERLERAGSLIDKGDSDAFSTAVSNAIRFYIEARFKVRAAHRTTEEFIQDLLGDPASGLGEHSARLGDFLGHCDLAKFARWAFSKPEMQSMLESARKFVRETVPQPAGQESKEKVAA